MARDPSLANVGANAAADAVSDLVDDGYFRIYDGTKPATADTPITTQTLLAELRFANPASGAAVAGVLTFSAITADPSANADGTATWLRAFGSDGTTAVFDGTVGKVNQPNPGDRYDLEVNTTTVTSGTAVSVVAFTYTQSKD